VEFALVLGMMSKRSHLSKDALQALFARAAARRAERRLFVQTLRKILRKLLIAEPLVLLSPERRLTPRDA
jgi:hypothetical protein